MALLALFGNDGLLFSATSTTKYRNLAPIQPPTQNQLMPSNIVVVVSPPVDKTVSGPKPVILGCVPTPGSLSTHGAKNLIFQAADVEVSDWCMLGAALCL